VVESLVRALQNQGVDAESVDLDPWAPTLDYIRGRITRDERNRRKRQSITNADLREAAGRFKSASKKHRVIMGDGPGGMSDQSRVIYQAATHAILVCREDRQNEIEMWKSFFMELKVALIAIVISKLDGDEEVISNDLIHASLVKLERKPKNTPAVAALASLLKMRLAV
jgi:hypothetical protein